MLIPGAMAFTGTVPAAAQQPAARPATPAAKPGASASTNDPADKKKQEEAIAAFKAGKAALAANDLTGAIERFKEADALYNGAAPRFLLAQTYEKLGRPADALAAYRAFLLINPNPSSSYYSKIPEAKDRIAALEKRPATIGLVVKPATAPGVVITVDGAAVASTTLSLSAGAHQVVVRAAGFLPHTETVTVSAAEKRDLVVTLQPAVDVTPPAVVHPPTSVRKTSRLPAFITLGAAGAAAVVGGVFGGLAVGAKSEFDEHPTHENADITERHGLIADVSFGVAGGAAIAGTVLWFVLAGKSESHAAARGGPTLAPLVGDHGGGVSGAWTF
jgi:hypothetical protein